MPYQFNPFTGTFDLYQPKVPQYVPTLLSAGETFTVPPNTQVLYSLPIVNDGGSVDIEGYLVHVNGGPV